MIGGLPAWVWWAIALGLGVTCLYWILANAIDITMRRWADRHGCPVCGAGRDDAPPRSAGPGREGGRGGGGV